MPSEKRQRQDVGRIQRLEAQRAAAKRTQRTKGMRNGVIGVVVILCIAGAITLLSAHGKDDSVTAGSTTTTGGDVTSTTLAPGTVAVTYPGPGKAITGDTPCPKADGSEERTTSFAAAPPTCIKAGKTYTATVKTTEGDFVVTLDSAKAPIAANNFVVLARYHYFDGVPFHRIVPGFVDQAGTPVDQASPDIATTPGYTIKDELPDTTGLASPADAYPDGTLAMANRGPDTGSSQFFVVVNGGGAQFASNPAYTVFGKVTSGLDVATAINEFGDQATNGTPTKAITITSVTITET